MVICGYGWLELVTEVTGVTRCCGWLQVVGGGKEWFRLDTSAYVWFCVVSDGNKWLQGLRGLQVVFCGYRW